MRPKRIHLIGVAGSGMSGLAGLLLALGHKVSGSDRANSDEVRRLQLEGLSFCSSHRADLVRDVDLVVYSSAIKAGNVAFDEALRLGKPLIRRAAVLADLMSYRRGILVAGMHGKTTTSAMAAHVLREVGLQPSYYVGAEIPILGTNAHWDAAGRYFVAEGDESDGTVSLFKPTHTILLNVEEEHLDYYKNLAEIDAVFQRVINQTQDTVFYCADDLNAARLCSPQKQNISFGSSVTATYRYDELHVHCFQSRFKVYRYGNILGEIILNVPGEHNVSNATSVIALASELGIGFESIADALKQFRGARRRFEFKLQSANYVVVDDYGHHPSEIQATLRTAKQGHQGRVVTIFQPHRYSRTQALYSKFGQAFDQADLVFVTSIYAADEYPIVGITGQTIVDALHQHGHTNVIHAPNFGDLARQVGAMLKPGDLLLSLGAGDVHEITTQIAHDLLILEDIYREIGEDGKASIYEPIAKHTTFRVGGPAQFWIEPSSINALAKLIRLAARHNLPVFVMGRGSNLIVRDGGISGMVIHPVGGEFAQIDVNQSRSEITAGAAVTLKRLSGVAARACIGGFEWMNGIPGSVGGSLRMNAGAMSADTFGQVISLRLIDSRGQTYTLARNQIEAHYRNVPLLKQDYALSATFQGYAASTGDIKSLLAEVVTKRRLSQPIAASAGCIFKNPSPECPAGKLVQEIGFKSARVGKASVSAIHGNFIVNEGGATAAEILQLIALIQQKAMDLRGIQLSTEVQIVGEG